MSDAEKGLREFIVARTTTPGMRDTMLDALSAALAAARAEGYARAMEQAAQMFDRKAHQYGEHTNARWSCEADAKRIRAMKDETP